MTKDVCKVLVQSNPTIALVVLDEDEKAKLNLGLPGIDRNIVGESGLYALIMKSRKSEAKVHVLLSCVDDDKKRTSLLPSFNQRAEVATTDGEPSPTTRESRGSWRRMFVKFLGSGTRTMGPNISIQTRFQPAPIIHRVRFGTSKYSTNPNYTG